MTGPETRKIWQEMSRQEHVISEADQWLSDFAPRMFLKALDSIILRRWRFRKAREYAAQLRHRELLDAKRRMGKEAGNGN